jgi:hypothetical protein
MLCQSDAPITLITGGCSSQGRWVGRDGKVRCSLHHIQEFGHGDRLVRVEGYQAPNGPKPPALPEKLPGTHAKLDAFAAERGIDLGDATTVAEKQAAIEAAS